jgi:hypothetical protein
MIYGYSARVVDDEADLLELREVTFCMTPENLRNVARFLAAAADAMDAGTFLSSHRHASFEVRDWDRLHPECDVIVADPPGTVRTVPRVR